MLSIRGLTLAFQREVVHGIDLDVERGRVVALVGESGSGKSVTAMSVLRLLGPEASVGGEVLLDGTDVLGLDTAALRAVRGGRVGMVFQEPMAAWNPVHTVGRQIREAAQAHGRTAYTVEELLASVGLDDPARIAASYPHELSGGQLQRAMIAMATSGDPELLIADEPTTALDVTIQAGILDVLRELRERLGTSIVLITHDLGVVADLADRVAVMYAGRVVETAEVHDLFAHPRHPYTTGLLGSSPAAPRYAESLRLNEIPGLVPVLTEQPDACTFADRCPRVLDICTTSQPQLTDGPHSVACWNPVRERVEV